MINKVNSLPWLIGGDFNQISATNEKFGGKLASLKGCLTFSKNIDKRGLQDLGFQGPTYTWSNRRYSNKHTLIRERLDRFLCNDRWLDLYPNSKVYHLSSPGSDHSPLVLKTNAFIPTHIPFRFETLWIREPTFPQVVSSSWSQPQSYFQNLSNFYANVKVWKKAYVCNIFRNKKNYSC